MFRREEGFLKNPNALPPPFFFSIYDDTRWQLILSRQICSNMVRVVAEEGSYQFVRGAFLLGRMWPWSAGGAWKDQFFASGRLGDWLSI